MASGWWRSTYANLESGTPNSLTVYNLPTAPRNYSKITSLVVGGGFYLAGVPCVTTANNVIYYAGDNYTQDVDAPTMMRWDGTVTTKVLDVPPVGSTPAKAIISIIADANGIIYFSTWDSGTTSTTFAGRVFRYNPSNGTITQIGSDVFKNGRLPYALTIHNGLLWVGVIRQDPSFPTEVKTINLTTGETLHTTPGAISSPTISSVVRAQTNNSYKLTTVNANGAESGPSNTVTYFGDPVLDTSTYNTLSWSSVQGASSYKIYRTAGHTSQGKIANPTGTSYTDTGAAGDGSSPPGTPSTAAPTAVVTSSTSGGGNQWQHACTLVKGGVESYATYGNVISNGPQTQGPDSNNVVISVSWDGTSDGTWVLKIYRIKAAAELPNLGYIKSFTIPSGWSGVQIYDNVQDGNGVYPLVAPPTLSMSSTDPLTTTTYQVTANNANGETTGSVAVSTQAKSVLTSSRKVTVAWGSVSGATSYNVYRTAGHTSTGKIVNQTTALSIDDTGLVGSGSLPTENTTGNPIGQIGTLITFNNNVYAGCYMGAGTFSTVQRVELNHVWNTSDTIAPGGSATAYNGFTAAIVFNGQLYMAYWNNDATPLTLIRKFDGSAWSTVKTISGSGARPILAFLIYNNRLYAYGGGDNQTGIFYMTTNGTTWTDLTSLLPTAREGIPFMGTVIMPTGF